MKMVKYFFIVLCITFLQTTAWSQQKDSLLLKNDSAFRHLKATDSLHKKGEVIKKKHDPARATLYSTVLPGLGQIYNKKYWKLPLVYAALGIPTYTFFYN